MKALPPIAPVPPEPYRFALPDDCSDAVGDLHERLADLGIQGVTRIGGKCYVAFPERIKVSVAKRLLARVRRPR